MRYGSLFSGIGGFDLGFDRAGMECAWQVEIDPKCQEVLGNHWPGVERYTDVRTVGSHNLEPVDVICGGFPCQDLSVAGRRAGFAGERSGLWFEFERIIGELAPRWVVIENVPGLLSSAGGRDFAILLSGLVERGYGVAWRVLDAQYFGLAQRRRRVFIVASLGTGRAAEVLFEREGGAWDSAPRREAGAGVAPTVANGINGSGLWGRQPGSAATYIPEVALPIAKSQTVDHYDHTQETYIAHALSARNNTGRLDPNGEDFIAYSIRTANTKGLGFGLQEEVMGTLDNGKGFAVAWHENKGGSFTPSDHAKALRSGASHSYQGVGVRRLTPTECERLQGFPDGWTEGQADSIRYRQLGNAVAVPPADWIGRRILEAS